MKRILPASAPAQWGWLPPHDCEMTTFRSTAMEDGCFLLEPRVCVPPHAISARSLRRLDKSAANLKKGPAPTPIDLSAAVEA